jgi:CRP-like cAMP-binding protein
MPVNGSVIAAIDRRSRSADVVALSETLLASVSASDFLHLVTDQASAADAQLKHLADWVRDLTDRLFELSTLGVQNRVDAELLRLAKNAGVATMLHGSNLRLDIPILPVR